jgi:hypothetical protein
MLTNAMADYADYVEERDADYVEEHDGYNIEERDG